MKEINKILNDTAKSVKTWSKVQINEKINFTDFLKINNINYWDIFSVEMARVYLPGIINKKEINKFVHYLKLIILLINFYYELYVNYFINIYNNKYKNQAKEGKILLFLAFQQYIYKDTVEPVISYISKRYPNYSIILAISRDCKVKEDLKRVNKINLLNYIDKEILIEFKKINKQIKINGQKFFKNKYQKEFLNRDGKYKNRDLELIFKRFFYLEMKIITLNALLSDKLIRHSLPSVIISPDLADPRNRIFINIGKNKNIATLDIQFGLIEGESIEWQFFNSDSIAVWGEKSKNELIKHGIAKENIVITGSPRHDDLINKNNSSIYEELNIKKGTKIILMASTYNLKAYSKLYNPSILLEMMHSVIDAVNLNENIFLIIKPHPREKIDLLSNYTKNKKNILIISKKFDIRRYIKECEVFISFGTTATADAIISNKLVFCPNFPGWIWSDIFISTGAVVPVKNRSEMNLIVESISNKSYKCLPELVSNRQVFIKKYAFKSDGQSSQRVAELILNLTKLRTH